ncbi:MAG: polysulfide reductase NrfD [Deltaproteobacteria bacterium]|nr:polysulfide reductase NrfD [Deltaproteobacteria bacterium]
MNEKKFKILMVLGIIGLIIGSWGMGSRLIFGHASVNYGSYVPWGLWVVFYLFFVGLTAGAFLITIMTYMFRVERLKTVGRLSAFTVLVALICELIFITLDLGHMERLYRFMITPSFTSLMTWFVIFTNLMLIIYLLESFFLLREDLIRLAQDEKLKPNKVYRLLALGKTGYTQEDRERDGLWVRRLSIISLPVGLLFYGTNGAFFAILQNRPIWNSAMTPLLFITAALLSGGALITALIYAFHEDEGLVKPLGQVILYLLVIFTLMEVLQFFVGYQSKVTGIVTSLNLIAFGRHWWSFWIIHLLLGTLIPLILLIKSPEQPRTVAWACFLIVVTFLTVRFNFLIPDLAIYKLDGLEFTFFHPRLRTNYIPSLMEWLVSLWIVSFGLIAFLAGSRWLPIHAPVGKGEKRDPATWCNILDSQAKDAGQGGQQHA